MCSWKYFPLNRILTLTLTLTLTVCAFVSHDVWQLNIKAAKQLGIVACIDIVVLLQTSDDFGSFFGEFYCHCPTGELFAK